MRIFAALLAVVTVLAVVLTSLGDDRFQRRGDKIGLYTHVNQTGHGAGRIIGVQGGKHKVARE